MNIAPEDVARRYAHDRPGLSLLHFEEVAAPLFRVTLGAVVQRRKPLPPIEEFVLRTVSAGLDSIDEVAGFLGLERPLVEAAIVTQWQADNLEYGALPSDCEERIRLSHNGRNTLGELQQMLPEQMELVVDFDRLTWNVIRLATPAPLRPRDVKDLGLRELPPRHTRRPEMDDLPVDDLAALLKQATGVRAGEIELLAVRNLMRAERIYEPAVMLVYGDAARSEMEVAFAFDGRLSRPHESALGTLGGAARLQLTVGTESEPELLQLEESLRAQLVPGTNVDELQRRTAQIESQLEAVRAVTATQDPSYGVASAATGLQDQLQDELERLRNELNAMTVRQVSVYEHPVLLQEALASTQSRLLIISPWISAAVVNGQFLSSLERLCRRGVKIHIGYGISDDKPLHARDADAENRLKGLATKFKGQFVLRRFGYTHAKVLIWDDRWVTTSFNWLSFKGDPKRTFRQEEGVLVAIKAKVDSTYEGYVSQFESEENP